jgi:glutamine synthetase
MLEMANRYIIPAVMRQVREAAATVSAVKAAGSDPTTVASVLNGISEGFTALKDAVASLQKSAVSADNMHSDILKQAKYYRDQVIPKMEKVRAITDNLECKVDANYWPFPTYSELLFHV